MEGVDQNINQGPELRLFSPVIILNRTVLCSHPKIRVQDPSFRTPRLLFTKPGYLLPSLANAVGPVQRPSVDETSPQC
jgi:hypothetical protein